MPFLLNFIFFIRSEIIESGDSVTITGSGILTKEIVGQIGIINRMKEVTVIGGFTEVGNAAFQSCGSLETCILPDTIAIFNINCFNLCSKLTTLTIPAGLTTIKFLAIAGIAITGTLTFPSGMISIDPWSCGGLKVSKIVFTNLNTECTVHRAFGGASSLTEIDFGSARVKLSHRSFENCQQLTSIVFGAYTIFTGNPFIDANLRSITVSQQNTQIYASENVVYSRDNLAIMLYPCVFTGTFEVPSTVTSVGIGCFGYSKLTTLNLNKVQILGSNAFEFCQITDIITSNLVEIGESCFSTSKITKLTLPNTLKTISNFAFKSCDSLAEINLPDSLTSIGSGIFGGCFKLATLHFTPNNPIYYYDSNSRILYTADKTNFIYIPTDIVTATIPSQITSVPEYCFAYCGQLKTITFNGPVKEFLESSFVWTGFEIFYIPQTLESFGESVFASCLNLKQVIFQENSKCIEIGNYVFRFDTSLSSIVFGPGCNIQYFGQRSFEQNNFEYFIIPSTIRSISQNCFRSNKNLKNVTLTSNSIAIDPTCFTACPLDLVIIDTTTVSRGIFSKMLFLETVHFSQKVQKVDALAFSDDPKLVNLIFEGVSQLTNIGSNAFARTGLRSVILPKSIESITASVFTGSPNLISVKVEDPTRFKTIDGVLYNQNLQTLILCPAGLLSCRLNENTINLGAYSFSGCLKLEHIYLSSFINNFADYCFEDCSSLRTLNIPKSITKIGIQPFKGCISLKYICFCGTTDELIEYTTTSISLIPDFTQFYVKKEYSGKVNDEFFGKKVLITYSSDPFDCPLRPTDFFTCGKTRTIPSPIFIALFFVYVFDVKL